ncbi:MAG: transporter, partial [Deltaproteobacteria bacterium]|nr:transporter [Deltaproteobacteria bacterium]
FETPWAGVTYTVGLAVPFGYADLKAEIEGEGGVSRSASVDSFNISDIALTPIQLNWSSGNFSFRLAETIIAPTGAYDVDKAVNLGRNYWGFDTTAASTYFNEDTGTEVSIAPGILANTRNDDTNYKTGAEFHLDFTANQFLFESFAIGIRGYVYRQLTGDSGSGADLGDFKGEAVGVGPGFIWLPKFAEGKFVVQGKWMTDVHSENRFDSDYFTLTISWTF